MKYIGAHVSIQGGVENAPLNASAIGANAFGLFTRNQRRWESAPFTNENITGFKNNLEESGIKPEHVLPHNSYLINIASPDPDAREKSLKALLEEAKRVEQLGLLYLNLHPGSHLNKISEEEALDLAAAGIDYIHQETEYMVPVIETTSGQGSNLGYKFEHLSYITNRVKDKNRIGVCIDTCHIFSAGYDIRTEETYRETMNRFERVTGFKYLKGVHLNDSLNDFDSKKDRHQSIGKGNLGIKPFELMMNDKRFDDIPIILETIDDTIWPEEIKLLFSLIK